MHRQPKTNKALSMMEDMDYIKEKSACLCFMATQAVWWMALYYPIPGMREFDKESVMRFQELYQKNYRECCPNNENPTCYQATEKCIETLNGFSDRTGFDFVDMTRSINPEQKLYMACDKYPNSEKGDFLQGIRKPDKKHGYEKLILIKGADAGIREAFQVAVQTLKQDFLFEDSTILDCIDKVMFVINQYGKGNGKECMNLEFIIRYIADEFDIWFEDLKEPEAV